jgi:IS5 family transposase
VQLLRPTRHFGAKAHIGVDSKEGIVHSVCTSAASVHDKHMLPDLLHGEEKKVWGDGGYQGQTEAIHEAAPQAQDMTNRRVKSKQGVDEEQKRKNRTKSRVRAKVEWPFRGCFDFCVSVCSLILEGNRWKSTRNSSTSCWPVTRVRRT